MGFPRERRCAAHAAPPAVHGQCVNRPARPSTTPLHAHPLLHALTALHAACLAPRILQRRHAHRPGWAAVQPCIPAMPGSGQQASREWSGRWGMQRVVPPVNRRVDEYAYTHLPASRFYPPPPPPRTCLRLPTRMHAFLQVGTTGSVGRARCKLGVSHDGALLAVPAADGSVWMWDLSGARAWGRHARCVTSQNARGVSRCTAAGGRAGPRPPLCACMHACLHGVIRGHVHRSASLPAHVVREG